MLFGHTSGFWILFLAAVGIAAVIERSVTSRLDRIISLLEKR